MRKNKKVQPLYKSKIAVGSQVQVISGKDKGQVGEVVAVSLKSARVFVKGLNLQQRHSKPRRQDQAGSIISKEGGIDYSNVLPFCDACKRGVRKLCESPQQCPRLKK